LRVRIGFTKGRCRLAVKYRSHDGKVPERRLESDVDNGGSERVPIECSDRAHLLSLVDSDGVLLDEYTYKLIEAGAVSINTSLLDCLIDVAVRGNLEACRAKIYAIDALKGCMNLLRIHESEFDAVEQEDERCVHGKLDKDWES